MPITDRAIFWHRAFCQGPLGILSAVILGRLRLDREFSDIKAGIAYHKNHPWYPFDPADLGL